MTVNYKDFKELKMAFFGSLNDGPVAKGIGKGLQALAGKTPELIDQVVDIQSLIKELPSRLKIRKDDDLFLLLGLLLLHSNRLADFDNLISNWPALCHQDHASILLKELREEVALNSRLISIKEFHKSFPDKVSYQSGSVFNKQSFSISDETHQSGIYKINDCCIIGFNGIITHADGAFFLEQPSPVTHELYDILTVVYPNLPSDIHRIEGEVISLISSTSSIYYHWQVDTLPKVYLAERMGFTGKYLIPINVPFADESLKLLEIAEERIVPVSSNFINVEKLLLPLLPLGYLLAQQSDDFYGFVKQLAAKVSPSNKFGKRLYISRDRSSRRKVINEDQVCDVLNQYGFEKVFLEDHTLEEQIAMFKNCEYLTGPHGSGIVNLLFMNPQSQVLEFFHPGYINYCMRDFAIVKDIEYECLVSSNPESLSGDLLSDIFVDPEHLHYFLQRQLGK